MTPEQRARHTIDALLASAGWAIQDVKAADLNAVREGITFTQPLYALEV